MALYDIATGTVTAVPESRTTDRDLPGAPPVCSALRLRLFRLEREERSFAYQDGVLVAPRMIGEARVSQIALERCAGRSTILRTRPQPSDIQLGGGVLSWAAVSSPEEPLSEGETIGRTSGEFERYSLATGARRTWVLPRARVTLENAGAPPAFGVLGDAYHTRREVFWIATRRLVCGGEANTCSAPVASDVYAAPAG